MVPNCSRSTNPLPVEGRLYRGYERAISHPVSRLDVDNPEVSPTNLEVYWCGHSGTVSLFWSQRNVLSVDSPACHDGSRLQLQEVVDSRRSGGPSSSINPLINRRSIARALPSQEAQVTIAAVIGYRKAPDTTSARVLRNIIGGNGNQGAIF